MNPIRLVIFFTLVSAACSDSSLKVVNSPPEAEITYPEEGAEVLEAAQHTLSGRVSDLDQDTETLEVRWYSGEDTVLCEGEAPSSSGDVSCLTTLALNAAAVRLEVVDRFGEFAKASVNFSIVPTEVPVAAIVGPTGTLGFYVDQLITFEGVVSDVEDDASTLIVEWSSSIDGVLSDVDATPNTAGEVIGFGSLSEGEHGLTMTVTDSTGKQSTATSVVVVGPPNTAPTCEITSPATDELFVPGETVNFVAQVSDVDVPSDWLSVAWTSSVDGDLGTDTPTGTGVVGLNVNDLSVGNHTIGITVTDEAGEICAHAIATGINSPPDVNITLPEDGTLAQEGENMTFVASVSDINEASDLLNIQWVSAIDGALDSASASTGGEATFSTDALSAGTHTVTLYVTDAAGESTEDSVTVSVNGAPIISTPVISYTDDQVYSTTTLNCAATAVDPEGTALTISYEWSNVSTGLLLGTGSTVVLSPSTVSPGDDVACEVEATDDAGGAMAAEASVVVTNSAPGAPTVSISPESPHVSDALVCSIPEPATDVDGDVLTYDFEWMVDGDATELTLDGASSSATLSVPASATSVDQTWTCTIIASDGSAVSAPASASVSPANTAPSAPVVSISPESAHISDALVCSITEPATDMDGDALTYDFVWTVNGVESGYSLDGTSSSATLSVPASATSTYETWTCSISANDGFIAGAPGSASVSFGNTPPSAPSVSISPESPHISDELVCSISAPATDLDGDTLTYDLEWAVDGVESGYSLDGASESGTLSVPAIETSMDETWICTVVASDGFTVSVPASASVSFLNDAPSAPTVSISPESPLNGAEVVCSISAPATDADGDALTYDFKWIDADTTVLTSLDGASASATLTIAEGETAGGESWTCTVIANDGIEDGPVGSATVIVSPYVDCGGGELGLPINSCAALEAMNDTLSETYCLRRDINCSMVADFNTVGDPISGIFSGHLMGNGFSISHFRSSQNGLFFSLSGEVSDLEMIDVIIDPSLADPDEVVFTGAVGAIAGRAWSGILLGVSVSDATINGWDGQNVGGLVGVLYPGSDVEDCHFSGTVSGTGNYTGGLVGGANASDIRDSSAWGTIYAAPEGGGHAGGIVANSFNTSVIATSSFSGDVVVDGTGWTWAGGLAGGAWIIENSNSDGTVTQAGDAGYAGGLAASAKLVSMSNSSSTVVAEDVAGGLLGRLHGGGDFSDLIETSFATGDVTSEDRAGGLVGENYSGPYSGEINACYALGDVDAPIAGGLIADVRTVPVSNSYSVGLVVSSGYYSGGLVGYRWSDTPGDVSESYWNVETSGLLESWGGEGRSTAEMTTEATFVGWNFTDTWTIADGVSYPCFQWQTTACPAP